MFQSDKQFEVIMYYNFIFDYIQYSLKWCEGIHSKEMNTLEKMHTLMGLFR